MHTTCIKQKWAGSNNLYNVFSISRGIISPEKTPHTSPVRAKHEAPLWVQSLMVWAIKRQSTDCKVKHVFSRFLAIGGSQTGQWPHNIFHDCRQDLAEPWGTSSVNRYSKSWDSNETVNEISSFWIYISFGNTPYIYGKLLVYMFLEMSIS